MTWTRDQIDTIIKRKMTDDEWDELDSRVSTDLMFAFKQAMSETFPNEY